MTASMFTRRAFVKLAGLSAISIVNHHRLEGGLTYPTQDLARERKHVSSCAREFQDVQCIALDDREGLHALSRRASCIVRFNSDHSVSRTTVQTVLSLATSFAVWEDTSLNYFVVVPALRRVYQLTADGRNVMIIGAKAGHCEGLRAFSLTNPRAVAVAPNGDIFVLDAASTGLIHQFSRTGDYNKSFSVPNGCFLLTSQVRVTQRDGVSQLWFADPLSGVVHNIDTGIGGLCQRIPCDGIRGLATSLATDEVFAVLPRALRRITVAPELNGEIVFMGVDFSDAEVCLVDSNELYLLRKQGDSSILRIRAGHV